MHRLIHLLLLLMLTGCAATLRTDIAADDAGYVVYSTGADEYSPASYYTLHFRDAARRESVDRVFRPVGNPYEDPPLDFDTPSFQGAVFVLRMKPGEYEIYNYTVRKPHAIGGDTLFTAGREFRIPFAVEKGKITYLGQYRAQVLKGRDDRDKEVDAYFYYIIEDQADRDLAIARARKSIPASAALQREVVVAPPLRHPLIRNEKWPESQIPAGTYYPKVK